MISSETLKSKLALSFTVAATLLMSVQHSSAERNVVRDVRTDLGMGVDKYYREIRNVSSFRRGNVFIYMSDGIFVFQEGCARPAFWPANIPLDPCPLGATGFLTNGDIDSPIANPYYSIISIFGAAAVAPYRAEGMFLRVAPASRLERPLGGFIDFGRVAFYNLLSRTGDIRQIPLTYYVQDFDYDETQKKKIEEEWVPGVYSFSLPAVNFPDRSSNISNTIFPMIEGREKIKNRFTGFHFTFDDPANWRADGFYQIKTRRPFTVRWAGVTTTNVIRSDKLYFVMRKLEDPSNPLSPASNDVIFPNFSDDVEQRILLQNPYTTSITLPPLFPAGTKAVIRLRYSRLIQNTGAAYDLSDRYFEIPVVFVN